VYFNIRNTLPKSGTFLLGHPVYKILQSYLQNQYFLIKYREAYTSLHPVSSGVPQGSVLGLLLYLLYTADLPAMVATFADDTAILATHADPVIATHTLQTALLEIQQWLKKMAYESQ
jgi:hypothetical protein